MFLGQKINILLFDRFSNHCLANTVEPMRAANSMLRHHGYTWQFLTVDGENVQSSSGMQVTPHGSLADSSGTFLFIMPSYGFHDYTGRAISQQIKHAAKRYDCVGGLDTGSWLMAQAGLLDGRRATIHWDELTNFAESFPNVDVQRQRFIHDGDVITCSGAMAAFDLIMHLIGQTHGQLLAMEVAQLFMTQDSARAHASLQSGKGRLVNKAISYMSEHLENPTTIKSIARTLGVSQKTLDARMKAELNVTPQVVYKTLRLNLARKLVVGTDQPVSEIAGRCGYENASAMTRAFKAQFGQTPRELRNT